MLATEMLATINVSDVDGRLIVYPIAPTCVVTMWGASW